VVDRVNATNLDGRGGGDESSSADPPPSLLLRGAVCHRRPSTASAAARREVSLALDVIVDEPRKGATDGIEGRTAVGAWIDVDASFARRTGAGRRHRPSVPSVDCIT
jgi:hypothetical protein